MLKKSLINFLDIVIILDRMEQAVTKGTCDISLFFHYPMYFEYRLPRTVSVFRKFIELLHRREVWL